MPPADATALVSVEGVRKVFRSGTVALDGVDLAVGRGDFLSILGPSGCGKSTLLRLVAGLAEPTAGPIPGPYSLRGRRRFGFQGPTPIPRATGWVNVPLPPRPRGG